MCYLCQKLTKHLRETEQADSRLIYAKSLLNENKDKIVYISEGTEINLLGFVDANFNISTRQIEEQIRVIKVKLEKY